MGRGPEEGASRGAGGVRLKVICRREAKRGDAEGQVLLDQPLGNPSGCRVTARGYGRKDAFRVLGHLQWD